ncbi:MAG: sporulation protein [Bacillota bacterium]
MDLLNFQHRPNSGEMVRDHQQFAFYPTGFMRDRFNELEILFNQNKNNLYLYLEIDRRARGISWLFTKALYLDENHHRFTVPLTDLVTGGHPDLERATELMVTFIEQVYRKK